MAHGARPLTITALDHEGHVPFLCRMSRDAA